MSIETSLKLILKERASNDTLRSLKLINSDLIDFSSNDYLGLGAIDFLSHHQEVLENGAGGSRLLSGNKIYHIALEEQLAKFFKAEACLTFSSGYTANLGLLSSVPQKDDLILMDEYAHICIKEGARLSRAKYHNFKHNNLNDLEGKLQRSTASHTFIVVESVYSMDGDYAPLRELVDLAHQYGAELIVDEAHSTGLLNIDGSGYCTYLGIEKEVFARVYTFGKAVGAHGACIVGSKTLAEFLVNYSRPFIYTTALPYHSIAAIKHAIAYRQKQTELWPLLQKKISLFKQNTNSNVTLLPSEHPIQGVMCNSPKAAVEIAQHLQAKGFDVRPIVSPTVPKGLERVRICLHIFNTDEEILSLCSSINEFYVAS